MYPAFTVDDILSARSELPEFYLDLVNDFFSVTWQASHIRLVELVPGNSISFPVCLAHILTRNPPGGFLVEEWLPNTRIQQTSADDLAGVIGVALEDLSEADYRPNEILVEALARLSIKDVQPIYSIISDDPNLPTPRSAYQYGPTYQYFWVRGGHFYYLEVHHES